jgi:hypothetical protein
MSSETGAPADPMAGYTQEQLLAMFPQLPPEYQEMILSSPALPPPDNTTLPDFSRPGNQNDMALAVSIICITLVIITGLMRIYGRLFVVKKIKIEDYLGYVSLLGYAAVAYCFYAQLHYGGFYVRQWDIQFRDLQGVIRVRRARCPSLLCQADPCAKSAVVLTIAYPLTMMFVKTAILLEWSGFLSRHPFSGQDIGLPIPILY